MTVTKIRTDSSAVKELWHGTGRLLASNVAGSAVAVGCPTPSDPMTDGLLRDIRHSPPRSLVNPSPEGLYFFRASRC